VIVTYLCHRCEVKIEGPFFVDANDRDLCRACFDATRPPVLCEGCGAPTDVTDRLPTRAGGFSCASCALKLANTLSLQAGARAVAGVRLTGPGFRGRQ